MNAQKGMALLVSLVFMLLLSLIGLASMASATHQAKMVASVQHLNHSFQAAEAALRSGESWLQGQWPNVEGCALPASCSPPSQARAQEVPGVDPISGVRWVGVQEGLYGVQSLGPSIGVVQLPVTTVGRLYRVTGIGFRGQSRTVLESIYARYQHADDGSEGIGPQRFRRVMWRQLQ